MLILGIESATPVASVALADERGLVGENTLNIGLTHSEQLLPMLDQLLQQTRCSLEDVAAIGISSGPGSFTGLRIGMATAKGLAQSRGIPVLGIPTLEAMAWQQSGTAGLVSAMQNARRNQIYGALYRWKYEGEGLFPVLEEVIPAEAAAPEEWAMRLAEWDEPVALMGDGAIVYEAAWRKVLGNRAQILPSYLGIARGSFVALAARERFQAGQRQDFYKIKPLYIRGI